MKKLGALVLLTFLINGCASMQPSIPDDYEGPVATIKDTAQRIDDGKADLFYLYSIDGKRIKNSRIESASASYGQGNNLVTVLLKNKVPAQRHVLTIVGRTTYAMPMRALMGTVYEVKGDVVFSPEAGADYIVKGSLSEERSMVWLEDATTGEVIEQIQVEGSSKLGFFQK